jgi:hypothetical protein
VEITHMSTLLCYRCNAPLLAAGFSKATAGAYKAALSAGSIALGSRPGSLRHGAGCTAPKDADEAKAAREVARKHNIETFAAAGIAIDKDGNVSDYVASSPRTVKPAEVAAHGTGVAVRPAAILPAGEYPAGWPADPAMRAAYDAWRTTAAPVAAAPVVAPVAPKVTTRPPRPVKAAPTPAAVADALSDTSPKVAPVAAAPVSAPVVVAPAPVVVVAPVVPTVAPASPGTAVIVDAAMMRALLSRLPVEQLVEAALSGKAPEITVNVGGVAWTLSAT